MPLKGGIGWAEHALMEPGVCTARAGLFVLWFS